METELLINVPAFHMPPDTFRRLKSAVIEQVNDKEGPFYHPMIGVDDMTGEYRTFVGFGYSVQSHNDRSRHAIDSESGYGYFLRFANALLEQTDLTQEDIGHLDVIFAAMCGKVAEISKGEELTTPLILFLDDPECPSLPGLNRY